MRDKSAVFDETLGFQCFVTKKTGRFKTSALHLQKAFSELIRGRNFKGDVQLVSVKRRPRNAECMQYEGWVQNAGV